ncbi:MAG: tyrosine-type recombinase/integrase, partial [Bacteroidia bacterium]
MANYYFRLRDLNTDKETPIILFAQINGNRIKCKTNETILPGLWDNDKKVPVKCKANKILIERLDYLKTIANDTFLYFRDTLKNAEPNSAEYQNEFYKKAGIESNKPKVKPEAKVTFFEFIDKYINETKFRQNKHTGKPIAQNTIKVYNQCKRLLKEFNDTKYKIDFDKLTLEFFLDFMEFLHAKNYNVNTIAKHMTRLKTFLNDAYERGYTQSLAHKSKRLSVTQVQSDTIYLTEPEIEELHKLDLSKTPKLDRARDLFLVGYYTGQRYTDYSNIKPESFKNGFIEVTQQKTWQTVVIPIHPRLNEIMAKYEGKYINSLPPAISNQKFNQYIKEVCKMVDVLNNEI